LGHPNSWACYLTWGERARVCPWGGTAISLRNPLIGQGKIALWMLDRQWDDGWGDALGHKTTPNGTLEPSNPVFSRAAWPVRLA